MIELIAKQLDAWLLEENEDRNRNGILELGGCTIRVVGQTALLEAKLELKLLNTADVDAYINGSYEIRNKFNELLKKRGRHLDPDSDKVWMPEETVYRQIFSGKYVQLFIAEPEYVILSKALKAPKKNQVLVLEYLAKGPSPLFLKLSQKYKVDLTGFVT